ncbi:helix-turn-helix domain-containing protein [Candidatus Enterococcus willemsii]|uniref:Transcriptional regulator n=1 Tax=Candidatus Enterococcus willemsii TaxID=1857215 RepID=A0ABQ6Z0I4_9ENTE|nr:helix-turn-helix transcriptional regulator [Enterococcus sp. CU12B]KAF1304540.1 transcriptional regulator [Enterococcus sp. CU12B]
MILSEKIIQLRKKQGWSQEELAMQMNVSRQAVSKWEQAQSIPDLDKILLLSQLFDVSTDYLLKDDLEIEEASTNEEKAYIVRRVSLEEANKFLSLKEKARFWVAFATFLCILSPIPLIWLGGAASNDVISMTTNTAGVVGLIWLLVQVAVAVTIFLMIDSQLNQYAYLEKEIFELEYGVDSMVKQRKEQFRPTYVRYNIIGVVLCTLSSIPLFASNLYNKPIYQVTGLVGLIFMISIGTFCFILVGTKWAAMQQLLEEGDYSREKKQKSHVVEIIAWVYWLLTTALYLFLSFTRYDWERSWIIWPIAGILFGAIMVVANGFSTHKK